MASVATMDHDGASSYGLSRDENTLSHVRRRVMGSAGWSWVRGGAGGAIGAPALTGQYETVRRAKSIPEILANSSYPGVATTWPSGLSTSESLSGQCPSPVEGATGRPAAVLRLLGQTKPPLPAELRPWGIGSAPLPAALSGAGSGYSLLRTASGSCHLGQSGGPPAHSGTFPPPPLRRTVSCVCEVGGGGCGSCSCVRRQAAAHASWVADVGLLQPEFTHTQASVDSTKAQVEMVHEKQRQHQSQEEQEYCARISDGAVDMCVDIDVDTEGDPTSPPAQPAAAPPEPPILLHLPPPAIPHLQATTTASAPQLYRHLHPHPHPHPPARFDHQAAPPDGAVAAGVLLPAHHLQLHNPQPSSSQLLKVQPAVPDWPAPLALAAAAGPGVLGLGSALGLLPLPSSLPFPSPSRGPRQRSVGLTRKRQPEPQTVA